MDNLPGYKPKIIDTRTFGEKVDEFFNPILTPLANALPDTGRPQYVPEDIPTVEEDYSNTINLIKDIAKRADISQQTKSDQINRLAQRAQKQQAQLLSMSAQPYENFSTYLTKRAGLAAQDLIMAPQRIGTAVGEAIGSFRGSVITGKPYEEVLAKNKKNRNELFYLSIPQIEQVLTKYGKGENLIKPGETLNDMLRRERESQYEMGANLGEAKDVIIQSLMGSDYGKIEVPKEFETVAGISGFIFDAVVDPTNLLPGVGIGVSGTKAISRKALRTAISNAENMEDLVLSVQKAVANGVDKKEVKKIFYTRLEQIGKKVTPAENIEVKPTKPTAEAPHVSSVEPSPNIITEVIPSAETVGEIPPSVVPREAKGTGVLRDLINKPTKPTGEAPPTIISKKPASVSVPEEQVGTITPTIPEKPPEAQISGQAGQGVSVNPSITPAKVIPNVPPSAVGDVPVQPAGDVPVPIKEKVVSDMPLTQGEKRIVEKAIPNKKELLRQIDEAIKKAPDERQYGGELYDARNRGGDEQIKRSFYGEKLNIPQIEFKIDGGARVYNTKEALMKFRDGVTKASQSKSKQPITKIPSNNPPIYKVSEHGAGESSDGFIADGIIYYKKDESNFLTPKRDLPSIKDRIALDPTNELKIQGFHLKGEGNKASQQKDFYGGAEWFSPEYMKPSNTFTDYTHHLYLTDKNGEVIVTFADIFQYLASKLKYDKIGVGEIIGIKAPVFLRKGEIIGGVAPVRVPYNPTERLAALKKQFTPDYFEPQVKTAKEIVEASTPTTEEIVKKPYPLADESGQAGQGVEGEPLKPLDKAKQIRAEEPKALIEAYQQKKWGILASHYKSLGLNSKEFFDQIAKNTVSTKDGLPFDDWESAKIFKQAQKSPSFILKEFKFTHIGNNSLKIEVISDNGKVVKFIDEKGRTGSYTKSFFESSYKPIKSPTEQLLEAPPAEQNFYEGVTNKEGMVELGAGFNPLKPFIENYETVAKPFVKTTETVDAVIRTMDNIAGGKVSQFVNKAFHGDTYREVRKELQVAGQMASHDIASVSDYVASTMTGKLNNDLTDWFANTKRAWSGLNVDFNKKVKTIMETLGDYAEIKQGTGVSTKEYTLLDYAGRREDKMVEKADKLKPGYRVIPNDTAILEANGFDIGTISSLEKLGFIGQHDFKGIHAGAGKSGVKLTATGKELAEAIIKRSEKSQDVLDRFISNEINKRNILVVNPEIINAVKKLPNLINKSTLDVGIDVRRISKYAPDEKGILRKAQEYSDDEIKRLVDDGYLHEYFNERGEQVYRLTDKGKAVRNEINQASFKDLAIYSDKKAFADVLKKAGINADKDTEEIAHFFVKWFQENTVNLAEKIPMSEKQLQKMKYQWGKYFPKQRATLSETGLRKIMDNPEIYTKEQVELATDIHNSIKNPKVLGVKVVEYRKNLADAIQRNVDLSDDGVKVPRQWQAEAGLPYNPDLKIAADAKDLVETQYLRSWAFNRSNKEFSDLLQAGRVGVKNVDLVNLTSRVMSKKYDAILPYITNPTDVLQGVMSKVSNTLRMNDAFENLAKHTEYVRTDLDPKLHGTSYTDVVDGVGVTYKYINPEQTEYLSLAGKYVNENVLRSIQTRIDGSAQSLSKFSLDSTWSKFLRPVWYAGMTSSNLSYHAINMVTSGVNMLLHAPQLGLRPFSVAKTSLKWFKTLGSPKLRREFADEIQDMIEHQIIGQENLSVNSKSFGTITRGNVGAFEINKTINKVGVTIQEILEMAPALANMSDQLARITYYQEKINDLKKIMQKADYKVLSPEQQADFVAQFKAKAADQAQTIIPSYIDTANALRAVNEVMPLVSWGMKAYKIPYRNLMTLLGKNDIKGFGNLSKSINMTEKAKAAFALIGLPALAGYYAYNKVQTNREQAMAEAGATPEYRNNFYDQKWCKMIPSIEDLFERQEDYLAAKYVIDAAFNRSFSFETKEGIVKVSGSNYGERYRLPEFSSPIVTYGNILFTGTKVNPFTGTGEPITDKEGWERAKDLLAYTLFVSSASSQRYNSEVRRLKKKGLDEKQARIQAYAKLVDAETLLRYDVITQEDLIKRTKGEQYRLKKQIAGLKKMTPEEQQKAIPSIEKQGERVRVRADLIDYLPKGKEE